MALNLIQQVIERSIFEAIRKVLVEEGYLPDITSSEFVDTNNSIAYAAEDKWVDSIKDIKQDKGFAAEIFGDSSQWEKGQKNVPRIVIQPTRIVPGDIGSPLTLGWEPNPKNYMETLRINSEWNSSHLQFDISVVTKKAIERVILCAVISKAIGVRNFLHCYDDLDNPNAIFFIHQNNFYDLLDDDHGISEKIYTYEVKDIFLERNLATTPTPLINQIKVNTIPTDDFTNWDADGEASIIDLSGATFT